MTPGTLSSRPNRVSDLHRGDVRLFRFPLPDKERPVVVLTRSSAIPYLNRVTVAPITSTIRSIPSEVVLDVTDGMREPCAINLDHVVTVPKTGLGRRLTVLSAPRLEALCHAMAFALGCGN